MTVALPVRQISLPPPVYLSNTNENFSVSYNYTPNGKLNWLKRYGKDESGGYSLIDDLSYTYSGNQLTKVDDAGLVGSSQLPNNFPDWEKQLETEYLYDANGNMYKDENKKLDHISYNHLNLPETVKFDPNNSITFTYDAMGNKLAKYIVENNNGTLYTYIGGFMYRDDTLRQITTEEGIVEITDGLSYEYNYYLKDHLGSIRVVFSEDGTGNTAEILQETHYYPFGMVIDGLSYKSNTENNKLFSRKEFNSELNLNWYDFHARNYDPQLVMWFNVDPLAENYHNHTPYNYCFSNPVNFTDPTGMGPVTLDTSPGQNVSGGSRRRNYGGMFEMPSFLDLWWAQDRYGNLDLTFSTVEEMENYVSDLAGKNGAARVNFVTGETRVFDYDTWLEEKRTASGENTSVSLVDDLIDEGIITEDDKAAAIAFGKAQASVIPNPNHWLQTAGPGGDSFTGGAIPCNQRLRCDIVNMTTGELIREGYITFRSPTYSERNDNLVVGEFGVLYSRVDQRSYDLMEILICPTRISNSVGDMIYNGMARPNEDLYYFKFYFTGQNGVKNGSYVWGTIPKFFNGTYLEFEY